MKILITGGTGLIGRAFIENFSSYKYSVVTRSVRKAMFVKNFNSNVDFITSLNDLENLNDFDAIINLAGEPIIDKRWTNKQKKIICDSRWQITNKLVELLKLSDNPPSVFISGSAIGVYGNSGYDIVDESFTAKNLDFNSKLCCRWEEIAREAEPYTRVVLIRTGIVLSKKAGALPKMSLPFKFLLGGRIGDGSQYMSWIHIQDHINAIDYLIRNKDIQGAVNLVSPDPKKNIEFTKILAKVLRKPAIFFVPKISLKALLGEGSCLLLDSQRIVPTKLSKNGFNFRFDNLEKALIDLLKK